MTTEPPLPPSPEASPPLAVSSAVEPSSIADPDEAIGHHPAVVPPPRGDWRPPLAVALALLAAVAASFHPVLSVMDTHIMGDPDTDAIRGLWGLDHIRRSILPPDAVLVSSEVNFPGGVFGLILPQASGLMVAPLGGLFGPVVAWNLLIPLLLWGFGFATAALVHGTTRSWSAGLLAGGMVVTQPMLLHSVGDGTAEHLALWSVPLMFLLILRGLRQQSHVWALCGGLAATLIGLDSPYHAVYAAVLGVFVLPFAIIGALRRGRRRDILWTLGGLVLGGLISAVALYSLYRQFDIGSASDRNVVQLLQMNATDIHTWWQFEWGPWIVRDESLAPTTIPSPVLGVALLLGLLGAPRSLPWMAAGLAMLSLSFGYNIRISGELARWWGAAGTHLGNGIVWSNMQLYELPGLSSLRFPQRWLVPSALAFAVGGAIGSARLFAFLQRFRALRPLVPVLALAGAWGAAWMGTHVSRIHVDFPLIELPHVAFAEWMHEVDDGAAILLPQIRPAPRSRRREDVPGFANAIENMSSSDLLYLQVIHGQAVTGYPNLKTLTDREVDKGVRTLLRLWDDLAVPALAGNPIPRIVYDDQHKGERDRAIAILVAEGTRFVVTDDEAINDEARQILRTQLSRYLVEEKHFDDGTGVTVFHLAPDGGTLPREDDETSQRMTAPSTGDPAGGTPSTNEASGVGPAPANVHGAPPPAFISGSSGGADDGEGKDGDVQQDDEGQHEADEE